MVLGIALLISTTYTFTQDFILSLKLGKRSNGGYIHMEPRHPGACEKGKKTLKWIRRVRGYRIKVVVVVVVLKEGWAERKVG